MHLKDLKSKNPSDLLKIAEDLKIENADRPSKSIIYPIAILLLFIFGYFNSRREN